MDGSGQNDDKPKEVQQADKSDAGGAQQDKLVVKQAPGESPEIPPEAIDFVKAMENAPANVRESFQSFMAIMRSDGITQGPASLFPKFTEVHITKWLDGIQEDTNHEYELRKTNRWFYLLYVAIALVALGLLITYLHPRDPKLTTELIILFIVVGTSIGAGIGINEKTKK